MTVKNIFDKKTIQYLKDNKQEITPELLQELRAKGNEGKQIALDILDLDKDHEEYYMDAFKNRMSFNGSRRLKKGHTKITLFPIHKHELEKCAQDIHHFKENYVKVITPQGFNFLDMRQYQDDFIDVLKNDSNDAIVSIQPRQCCASQTPLQIKDKSGQTEKTFKEVFEECKAESL